MNNFLKIILLLLCAVMTVSCDKKKKTDKFANYTPEKLYDEGMEKMRQSQFTSSIEYFERINQEYPYATQASKAQIMESYAYYKTGKFEDAIASLEDYINLYPGEKNIAYAYYLKALCYYDQIMNVKLDQLITEKAKESLSEVINKFPDSNYARDSSLKLNLVLDHLAGKELEIGRFYLAKGETISAINRFKIVVEKYQTTAQIEEALYRLVECYYILGVEQEANRYAIVLGNNFPTGKWYKYAYKIISK